MKTNLIARTLAALALTACASFGVHAATVTFTNLSSGDGNASLFDPGASIINGDTLEVGLNSFAAATSLVAPVVVKVDSFAVKVTALPGYYISTLDYGEVYDYAIAAGGIAGITLTGVANGNPSTPAFAFFGGGSGSNVGIAISQILFPTGTSEVFFNISNTLFAFTPAGVSSIGKTAATLAIGTTPVPLPPALGLLGAALIGLATVRPRRTHAC